MVLLTSAASKSTLSQKATSTIRSTPSGATARTSATGSAPSSDTAAVGRRPATRSDGWPYDGADHSPRPERPAAPPDRRRRPARRGPTTDASTGPSENTARCAVTPGIPRQADSLSSTPSGRSTASPTGRRCSRLRCRRAGRTARRTPTPAGRLVPGRRRRRRRRSRPCRHCGGSPVGRPSARSPPAALLGVTGVDPGVAQDAYLAGPGLGSASSPTTRTSAAGPCRSYQTASTTAPFPDRSCTSCPARPPMPSVGR